MQYLGTTTRQQQHRPSISIASQHTATRGSRHHECIHIGQSVSEVVNLTRDWLLDREGAERPASSGPPEARREEPDTYQWLQKIALSMPSIY